MLQSIRRLEAEILTSVTRARAARPRQDANAHGIANHDRPPSIWLVFSICCRALRTTLTYAFVVDLGALAMAYRSAGSPLGLAHMKTVGTYSLPVTCGNITMSTLVSEQLDERLALIAEYARET